MIPDPKKSSQGDLEFIPLQIQQFRIFILDIIMFYIKIFKVSNAVYSNLTFYLPAIIIN